MEVADKPLRVLLVEDSPEDAELVILSLRRNGFSPQWKRVEDAGAVEAALRAQVWDVVLADYSLPTLTGMDTLEISRRIDPDVPVIIVSGAIGEDVAVEAMRRGARDYVLKNSLNRLPAAIARELKEAALRRERRRDEEAQALLARATARLVSLFEVRASLEAVVHEVVPTFACCGIVDLARDTPTLELETVALAHGDPAKEADLREVLREQTHDPDAAHGVMKVVREGRSELYPEVDVEDWKGDLLSAEYPQLLRAVDARSYMCVPMHARGRVIGAITLISSNPRRRFSGADLRVAEELARRTASAVDNAALYARAQEAIRLRDDFLSIASHELKTPITALKLQLQNLRSQAVQTGDRTFGQRADRAIRQVDRLVVLVSSLLDVTRIASGRMHLNRERFDLGQLLEEVAERMAEEIRRAGCRLELRVGEPLFGRWDRLRIDQVITNLLGNALKYGAGGPVELSGELVDDHVEVRVADRGVGLSPHDAERIFGRFERAASSRAYGGLGLGLYIARQVVAAHGGTISGGPREGGGAVFTFRLPLEPPHDEGERSL